MYRPTLPNELPPWFFEQARNKKKHTTPAIKWPEAMYQVGQSKDWKDYKASEGYSNWRNEPARSWNQVRQHLASVNSAKPKDQKPMTWREAQRELKRQKQAKKLAGRKAKKQARKAPTQKAKKSAQKPAQKTLIAQIHIPPPPPTPKTQEILPLPTIPIIPIAPTPVKIEMPTMPVFSDASHDEYIPSNATLFDPRDGRNEIPSKTYPIHTSTKTEQPSAIKTEIQHHPTPQKTPASTSPFSIIPQSLLAPFPPITEKAIEKIIHKNHLHTTAYEVMDSMAMPWWACETDTSFDELHSCDISSLIQRILDEQNFITPKSVRETTPDKCWSLRLPMRMTSPIFKVMREYIGMQRNLDDIFSMIFFQAHSMSKLSPFGAGVLIIDHTTTNIFCFFDPIIHTNTYQQVEHSELFGIQLKYDMLREIFKKSNYATDRNKICWERAARIRNGRIVTADIIHFNINSIVAPIEEDKKFYFYLRAFYQNKRNNRPLYPIRNVVLDVNECKKRLSSKAIPVSQYMPYSTGFVYNHALFTLKSANIPGLLELLDRKNTNENGHFYVQYYERERVQKDAQALAERDREMHPEGKIESLLVPESPKAPSTALSPIPPTPQKLVEDTPFIQTTTRQRPFEYQTKPYSLHPPHYPEETNRKFARMLEETEQSEQRQTAILARMPQELKQKIQDIEDNLEQVDFYDYIARFIRQQFIIETIARENAANGIKKILIKMPDALLPLYAFIRAMNLTYDVRIDGEFSNMHYWGRLQNIVEIHYKYLTGGTIEGLDKTSTIAGLLDIDFYRTSAEILKKTFAPDEIGYIDFFILAPPPMLHGECFVYMLTHNAYDVEKLHLFIWKFPQKQKYYGSYGFRIPIWRLKEIVSNPKLLQERLLFTHWKYFSELNEIFWNYLRKGIMADTIIMSKQAIYHFPFNIRAQNYEFFDYITRLPAAAEYICWPIIGRDTPRDILDPVSHYKKDSDFVKKTKGAFTKAYNDMLATGKIEPQKWTTIIKNASEIKAFDTLDKLYQLFRYISLNRERLYLADREYNTIQAAKLLEIIRPLLPKKA